MKKLVENMLSGSIPENAMIFLNADDIPEVFTKQRLALIRKIHEGHPESIQALADALGRKKQAVHRDLKLLLGHNVVGLEKKGREVVPTVTKEYIYVPLMT